MQDFSDLGKQDAQQAAFSDGLDTGRAGSTVCRFSFGGNAGEYFRIWMVNLLLSVLTLSLYSPWAKVRRLRYFYGNTHLAGRSFDFTGVPARIFIGRIIALVFFGLFLVLPETSPEWGLALWLAAVLLMPWLLRSTMRFRARNTKYGNSRFRFTASLGQTYWLFLKCGLVTVFSLGFFYPFALYWYKSYQINHLKAGNWPFRLNGGAGGFFGAVWKPGFMLIGVWVVLLTLVSLFGGFDLLEGEGDGESAMFSISLLFSLLYAVMIGFITPLVQGYLIRATWQDAEVGGNRISTDLSPFKYAWIKFGNYVLAVLTLGLMYPWGAVRLYRYQAESMFVYASRSPDELMNELQADEHSIGEEIADVFDFDISL